MDAGEIYEPAFNDSIMASHFALGHRLRIEVLSNEFPTFERYINKGSNDCEETNRVTADDTSARLWDATTGEEIQSLGNPLTTSVALSADGRFALTGGDSAVARLWYLDAGRLAVTPQVPSRPVEGGEHKGNSGIYDVRLFRDGQFAGYAPRNREWEFEATMYSCANRSTV
jgi:WD40 repeat protein